LHDIYPDINVRLTDEDIDKAIKAADTNGDGHISLDEFIKLIQ